MKCNEHPENPFIKVCVTCESSNLVCVACIEDKHRGHSFHTLDEAGTKAKKRLEELASQNARIIQRVANDFEECNKEIRKHIESETNIKREIQERKSRLHSAISSVAEKVEWGFVKTTTTCREILRQHRDQLQINLNDATVFQDVIAEKVTSNNMLELIKTKTELQPLNLLHTQVPISESYLLKTKEIDESQLQEEFGEVKSIEIPSTNRKAQNAIKPNFCHPSGSFLSSITPASANHCWIVCKYSKCIELYNKDGKRKHKISCLSGIYRVITTDSGNILACEENRIIKISYGQTPQPLFTTGDMYPNGICSLASNDIAVILIDDFSFQVNRDSRRVLVKCTQRGGTKKEVQYDKFGDRLFAYPYRICINGSKNTIVVVNRISPVLSHLVFFDNHLRLIHRYFGGNIIIPSNAKYVQSPSFPKVFFSDAAFDQNDDVILVEVHTKSIQLLSIKTSVVTRIIRHFVSDPRSVALHRDDEIWVGSSDGQIYVFNNNLKA